MGLKLVELWLFRNHSMTSANRFYSQYDNCFFFSVTNFRNRK